MYDCDGVCIYDSDFSPSKYLEKKIKKKELKIHMKPNIDILKTLSQFKKKQFVVGFALETDNELRNAIKKITNKKLDLIVLNSMNDKGSGFEFDTNKVTIIDKSLGIKKYPLMSKNLVADTIFNEIILNVQ